MQLKDAANAACLRKWFGLMMQSQDDLAVLMTVEQGKPLTESKGEVAAGASYVEWAAAQAYPVRPVQLIVPFAATGAT